MDDMWHCMSFMHKPSLHEIPYKKGWGKHCRAFGDQTAINISTSVSGGCILAINIQSVLFSYSLCLSTSSSGYSHYLATKSPLILKLTFAFFLQTHHLEPSVPTHFLVQNPEGST